jgi:hypothetical protein
MTAEGLSGTEVMENWNGTLMRSRQRNQFYLANRSRTLVKVKKGLKFTPEQLFLQLQDVRFPLQYVEGLDAIYFTVIPKNVQGYYCDGTIWIDVSKKGIGEVLETFVHEVGHFLDDEEDLSGTLSEERKKRHRYLDDPNAKKDDGEYLATGFERFYSEDRKDRKALKRHNPKLHHIINALHRSFKRK